MKWTKEQENSIYAKPSQIVVSAAAGSGKTQVLTTRIIERIKDTSSPVSVEKLLVVTFTKAAAAEMKERIAKALRNEANQSTNSKIKKHMKKQLTLLGSAQICTIDSFCYDVVKQNFFKANLPSDISIGENGELTLLRLSALEDTVNAFYCALEKMKGNILSEENLEYAMIIEEYFPDKSEREFILHGFEALTNACSYDKRDSEFSENILGGGDYTTMISDLYKKAQSAAYPEKWLEEISDMYDKDKIDYSNTPFSAYCLSVCKNALLNASKSIKELSEVSESNDIGYENFLADESEFLYKFSQCKTYEELHNFYANCELFPRITGGKTKCNKEIKSQITDIRTKIKNRIKKELLPSLLEFSSEECENLRTQLYPQIKALCSAAILLGKLYYKKMTERKIIDFSTCEHLALKIISDDGINLSETGIALKNRYDEIYIDEYQDSNDLQDMLFGLISNGRCFMVGDIKQSIYGFRNADPSIFMNKCNESLFDEDALKRKIFLSKNFRSCETVINGANSIFDVIMTEDSSGINYKKDHRLDFGADFIPVAVPNEKCEIIIVEEDGNSETKRFNEALTIAEEIKNIISSDRLIWDKDEGVQRPIKYSDIAVLYRSLKSSASIIESAFVAKGIPCYLDGNNDLYQTVEVGQILEILKLIDNAQSEIPLACTLRSPMFMFDENELLQIRMQSQTSFCDAFYGICSYKYKVSPALAKKCRNFNNQLTLWRNASGFLSVEELIQRIYTDTNIYSIVLSFPDGQLRRANLDLLLEQAEEFERSTYSGLFNFVNYVQKIKKSSDTTSEAKSVSDKMNVVRIMTIHKSKGLEFPVVFLAGCGNTYNTHKAKAGGLIINSRGGIGMDIINPLLRCKYPSPMRSVLLDMEKNDDAHEEMRLLYVALTRAREKIYAVGTLSGIEKFEEKQLELLQTLSSNEILSANSYFSLIALAYSRGASKYWNITAVSPEGELADSEEDFCEREPFAENSGISALLEYEYPYKHSVNLPNKASVSLLKSFDFNLAPSEDGNIPMLNTPSFKKTEIKKPDFRKDKKRGTFFGSAHHKLLQYIDYNCTSVNEECDRLKNLGFLTDEEYEVIDREKITEFLSSSLGSMLKSADEVFREESFIINIKANEIDSSLPESESVCVQGIIDCFFEYDGKVILVDYKTDRYDDPCEIAEKYKKQLYYYEKALKIKFNTNFVQKYLYLMHKNDIIVV